MAEEEEKEAEAPEEGPMLMEPSDAELNAALESINAIRQKAEVGPVDFDPLLCDLAQERAGVLMQHMLMTHYTMDGKKPYQLYFEAGVMDHMEEVIGGQEVPEAPADLVALITGVQTSFGEAMEMAKPEGAYHKSIVGKGHTHVGIGAKLEGTTFRYVAVFVDRYVRMDEATPTEIVLDDTVEIKGTVLSPDKFGPYGAVVYFDPPMGNLQSPDLTNMQEPYQDFSDEQMALIWPWEMGYNDEEATFSFNVDLTGLAKKPNSGSLYVQVFLRDEPDDIPRESTEGVEVPGDKAICAVGWVLKILEGASGGDSITVDGTEADAKNLSLEEHAARRDALAMSSKPDQPPIVSANPIVGVGMIKPDGGWEQSLYMPVERQEQVTTRNFGIAFQRLDLGGEGVESAEVRAFTIDTTIAAPASAEPLTLDS